MDEVGVSDSTVFIKVEKVDETDSTSEADINEEGDSFFYCDAQIDVKEEGDALHSDEDTSNDGVIKEGKEDDTESTFPTEIKHEEGSLFCYGGLIPQQVGETFVPGDGGLSRVKEEPEEEEMILPDDGVPGQVKEEEEMIIPDNVPAVGIKQEEDSLFSCGDQDSLMEKSQEMVECDLKNKINVNFKNISNASLEPCGKSSVLKKHQCPHCKYKAAYLSKLKKHVIVCHTGEKPHGCPICDYKAVKLSNLKIHIMAHHSNEKPYPCPHCDYKAVTYSTLKTHIRYRHTGEKPHQCPHCDYRSVTISCLKKHIMARHLGEKPHKCPHCDYRATQNSNLKKHIKYLHMYINE